VFGAIAMSISSAPWCVAPPRLKVTAEEVHVWAGDLDQPPYCVEKLSGYLTADERHRADRFHFERDREHFIVARGILRDILGRYVDVEPGHLRFCYGKYGKPGLSTDPGTDPIRFNVSHSKGLALFAVTYGREVGVDVEWIRPGLIEEQIPERFFSANEVRVLRSLPRELQTEAFFNCWTRKEAYIKAKGEGLSMPLDCFDVSLAPGEAAALLSTRGDADEASRWSLSELDVAPGFAAALVVEDKGWRLKCFQWVSSHKL
jgi:4'-phosphopantetheinyl transferase